LPDGTIPFSHQSFDVIAAIMVLEHVEHPRAFLEEIARVLRPGGRFLGHTISGSHYVTRLRRLIGVLPHSFNQKLVHRLYGRPLIDTFPAYYRLNTAREVRRTCGQAGLRLLRIQRYADPGYFRFAKPVEALAVLTDRLLESVREGWGRLYFTFIAEKTADADGREENRPPEVRAA
jgi:SAM-dependent methyltransferase